MALRQQLRTQMRVRCRRRERTPSDPPILWQDLTRRRSSRIAYVGLIYNFGKSTKKPKKEDLQFDNTL